MRLLLVIFLISSCSALRKGWTKVDFLSPPSDVMVCSFTVVGPDGDIVGKCADWNDVNEGLDAIGHQQKLKTLHGK